MSLFIVSALYFVAGLAFAGYILWDLGRMDRDFQKAMERILRQMEEKGK